MTDEIKSEIEADVELEDKMPHTLGDFKADGEDAQDGVRPDDAVAKEEIALPTLKLGMHGFLRKPHDIAVAQVVAMNGDGTCAVTYTMKSTLGRPAWEPKVRLGLALGEFWPEEQPLQDQVLIDRSGLANLKPE